MPEVEELLCLRLEDGVIIAKSCYSLCLQVSVNRWDGGESRGGGEGGGERGGGANGARPQRSVFRGSRSKLERLQLTGQVAQTQRSNVTTISDITTPYTASIPSSAGHFRGESDEEEEPESETDDGSDESESRGLSSPIEEGDTHCSTTPASSKKHEDLDSDEWYSESEANWTIPAHSKEVTPSQPSSFVEEETPKPSHRKTKSSGQQTSTAADKVAHTDEKVPVQQLQSATHNTDSTQAR